MNNSNWIISFFFKFCKKRRMSTFGLVEHRSASSQPCVSVLLFRMEFNNPKICIEIFQSPPHDLIGRLNSQHRLYWVRSVFGLCFDGVNKNRILFSENVFMFRWQKWLRSLGWLTVWLEVKSDGIVWLSLILKQS